MTDLKPLIDAIQAGSHSGSVLSKVPGVAGLLYAINNAGYPVVLDARELEEQPQEKRGRYSFAAPADFARYVHAHAEGGTAVFVNSRTGRATAIIDGHAPGPVDDVGWAGHGRHTALLELRRSASWDRIADVVTAGPLSQERFANWLDDIRDEIRNLDPEELIELVDTLHVFSNANQKEVRASGHGRSIAFADDVTVKAGKAGVELPNKLTLESTVFDGVPKAYRFEARLSVIAAPGQPTRFKVAIPRLTDVIDAATEEAMNVVRGTLADLAGDGDHVVPIYAGTAEHGGTATARFLEA